VREVNAESWHLSTTFGNATLHAALFIRDAFHLKPDDEDHLPPRLIGDVPNLSSSVPGFDPYEAALAWPEWWERTVEYEGALALGEFSEGSLRDIDAARSKVFDPPNFVSMEDTTSLRSLASAAHREALRWSKYHASSANAAVQRGARSSVVARVAWETCASLHVKPSSLRATVLVLDVEGSWRSSPRPGLLLCSANVLRKESLFAEYLRETFLENLGRDAAPEGSSWPFDQILHDVADIYPTEFYECDESALLNDDPYVD
jgi:hypothetical protein